MKNTPKLWVYLFANTEDAHKNNLQWCRCALFDRRQCSSFFVGVNNRSPEFEESRVPVTSVLSTDAESPIEPMCGADSNRLTGVKGAGFCFGDTVGGVDRTTAGCRRCNTQNKCSERAVNNINS